MAEPFLDHLRVYSGQEQRSGVEVSEFTHRDGRKVGVSVHAVPARRRFSSWATFQDRRMSDVPVSKSTFRRKVADLGPLLKNLCWPRWAYFGGSVGGVEYFV